MNNPPESDARCSMEAFALMREELRRERALRAELLEALKGMVEMREYGQRGLLHPCRHELDIVTDARAAIAKATQEPQE